MQSFVLGTLLVASFFGLLALVVFGVHANQHIRTWKGLPHELPTLSILLIAPVWAFFGWLIVAFPHFDLYFLIFVDFYEAVVIYQFMALMIAYLGGYADSVRMLQSLPKIRILFCFQVHPDERLLKLIRIFVFQFVVVKPLTAIAAAVCDSKGLYTEGTLSPHECFGYISFVKLLTLAVAMVGLFIFYRCCHLLLRQYHVVRKFVVIKLIIFLHILQNFIFQYLVAHQLLVHDENDYVVEMRSLQIQYTILCFEMFVLAAGMMFFFPADEVINSGQRRRRRSMIAADEDLNALRMESISNNEVYSPNLSSAGGIDHTLSERLVNGDGASSSGVADDPEHPA